MKTSVIVLSYNRRNHLRNCLASLANQIDKDFEVIVSDAGSTEDNLEVAESYGKKVPRLVILHHPHSFTPEGGGIHECAKTANAGLSHANGQVIQFLQHDHILAPTYLMHLDNIFTLFPMNLVQRGIMLMGYCSYLKQEVPPEEVETLARWDEYWNEYPRWARFYAYGMTSLVRCPDWRGVDGFDCAIKREDCLPFDEEFKGQGHEHMDWVYRLAKQGTIFLSSPLLRHYHQPHSEVRPQEQWQTELKVSIDLFTKKHGEGAWREQIG